MLTNLANQWPRYLSTLLLVAVLGAPAGAAERVQVFLFAGQSNMVGSDARADFVDRYPPFVGAAQPQADVSFSYFCNGAESEGWQPLGPVEGSFGPELTFVRKVRQSIRGPIAIIKCAVGGTTIAHDWNTESPPEGKQLFQKSLRRIRSALADLEQRGAAYDLRAMFWHQGENDMLNRKLHEGYAGGLTRLIAAYRKELEAPELDWFVGEVSDKGIWGMDHRSNMRVLRASQRAVVDADEHVWWVPTSHLAFEVMGSGQPHYHFGTQGQLQHGEAYADAYLRVHELGDAAEPTKTSSDLPVKLGKKPIQVFLVLGQRNMEGEDAFVIELPGAARKLVKPQSKVLFRCSLGGGSYEDSAAWERLRPIGHLGNFGPELSLGNQLRRRAAGPIAILKITDSAAQLSDWEPSAEDANRPIYTSALTFIRSAMTDLENRGHEATIVAVFWHHGENETYFGPFRARYGERLTRVIAALRKGLELPELPWFLAQQSSQAPWGEKAIEEMNASLRAVAEADAHVTSFKTSDLPHERIHHGTLGTLRLGERFAEVYSRAAAKRSR